jgi:hypothetical protein
MECGLIYVPNDEVETHLQPEGSTADEMIFACLKAIDVKVCVCFDSAAQCHC